MSAIPPPRFDHVVIYVGDRLDDAAALYQRLGFQLTERGHHTLGSSNHLAIFGTDYLELLGYEPDRAGSDKGAWAMPPGLAGLVFKPGADDGFRDAVLSRGVPAEDSREFSRPVAIEGGEAHAKFRVTQLPPEIAFNGRVFFCHHFTPELVWRPEWQRHANGVTGIAEFVVVSGDPARTAAPYRTLYDDTAFAEIPGGVALQAGQGRLLILNPEAARAHLGEALPDLPADGADKMVGLVLRTASLEQARQALSGGAVPFADEGERLLVTPAGACGLALGFVA